MIIILILKLDIIIGKFYINLIVETASVSDSSELMNDFLSFDVELSHKLVGKYWSLLVMLAWFCQLLLKFFNCYSFWSEEEECLQEDILAHYSENWGQIVINSAYEAYFNNNNDFDDEVFIDEFLKLFWNRWEKTSS